MWQKWPSFKKITFFPPGEVIFNSSFLLAALQPFAPFYFIRTSDRTERQEGDCGQELPELALLREQMGCFQPSEHHL